MRSLFAKITLAFVLVSLVGAGLAVLIIQQRTRSAFDRFLFDQNIDQVAAALSEYYQAQGGWGNIGTVMVQIPSFQQDLQGQQPRDRRPEAFPLPYLLVDANGNLVYGRLPNDQQSFTSAELKRGVPIEVDGQTVGWLLSTRSLVDWERNSPQGVFLMTVNQAILIGAIGAILASLLLGGLLARSLTSPLHELAAATRRVAQGALGVQVPVRSNDEIGQLTGSFNQMSADLETSNRLRKQMTADIAHDLRNPLSILLGYTEALSDGKLSGNPEIFDTMHDSAGQLSRLVDDLRTLSLAEAGELPIQRLIVSPAAMLERARLAYAAQAEARGVELQVHAGDDLPPVNVDPERMVQVFANLVSNALRYTPPGGLIELSAREAPGFVLLTVRDTGSGIAPEDLPLVFNRFYRGDRSRQVNGDAGLGLTIAKSLVTAQGGEIEVASQPGEGATFTIRFPAA
jgi:two-component system sensor histidine kinase BaeS